LFLCCGVGVPEKNEEVPPISAHEEGTKLAPSVAELARLYKAANSEYERRAVCLRAIDEGLIRLGGHVSSIDEIFGTHFSSNLQKGNGAIAKDIILFATQISPTPAPGGRPVGVDYVGWYMAVEYNDKGDIQNYYLTNLHKGNGSARVDGKVSISELRTLYVRAQTEFDRRAVCLRAIDEGALITYRSVSPVDEIFGTHFASNLPVKKEAIRKANVEFSDPKAAAHSGWLLAIEYDTQGTLLNYYLTNIHR
jgi:hypothetical protein